MLSDKEINNLIEEEFLGYCVHDLKYNGAYAQCQKCEEIYAAAYVPNMNTDYIYDPKKYMMLMDKLKGLNLNWSIYWTGEKYNSYEVEITNPELLKAPCSESGDDRVGLAEDSEIGRAICLAILDMKGIKVK